MIDMRYKDEMGDCKENITARYNIKVINKLVWEPRTRSGWRFPVGFAGESLFELDVENV